MSIKPEEVQPDLGRVTAGIPSLDSPKRFQHDQALVTRDYRAKIDEERRDKETHSFRPDGDQPKDVLAISEGRKLTPEEFIRRLSKLNHNLWFERSGTITSQMMLCLKVPISEDYPKGLRYIGGFNADKPINERDWVHVTQRYVHTREGFLRLERFHCHGCKECSGLGAIGGVIRGYRGLLKRLEDAELITPTQTEKMFGSGETKNWKFRHGA